MYVSEDLKAQILEAKEAGLNGDKEDLVKHLNSALELVEVVEGLEKYGSTDSQSTKDGE